MTLQYSLWFYQEILEAEYFRRKDLASYYLSIEIKMLIDKLHTIPIPEIDVVCIYLYRLDFKKLNNAYQIQSTLLVSASTIAKKIHQFPSVFIIV